jgi:hypothetical protein
MRVALTLLVALGGCASTGGAGASGGASAASGGGYSVDDLKALEKQGAWRELLGHLDDVAPSRRDAEWQRLAEAGAIGYLSEVKVTEEEPLSGMHAAEQMLKRYPTLKQSQPFMRKRAEVGVKGLLACFGSHYCRESEEHWRGEVLKFAQSDPPNVALPAAEMQMKILTAAVAIPLYELVLGTQQDAPLCKDAGLHKAVIGALEWNNWYVAKAQRIAGDQCWSDLKGELLVEFDHNKEKGYPKSTCDFLIKKNALSQAQRSRCKPPED